MRAKYRPTLWLLPLVIYAVVARLGTFNCSAHVLDDFNDNLKTAWQDFSFNIGVPYSDISEQNSQFKFTLQPVGQPIFSASTKTSETFTLQEGRTVVFSVDLVSGNGPDSFAILAFIPTSSSVSSLAGYGFTKSTTDILITKGIGKYFYNENPTPAIKNDNVTMVLSMTVKNGSVILNAKVLDKDNNNAVIFEQTAVDTPAADVRGRGRWGVAGSLDAKALTGATTSGGKRPVATRSGTFFQTCQAFLKESLAPQANHFTASIQALS